MLEINKNSKGSVLFLALVIISAVLGIALGLSNILMLQFKTIKGLGESVIAFYAADSGAEYGLYKIFKDHLYETGSIPFYEEKYLNDSGSQYNLYIYSTSTCPVSFYCLRSIGTFKQQRRAIQIAQ